MLVFLSRFKIGDGKFDLLIASASSAEIPDQKPQYVVICFAFGSGEMSRKFCSINWTPTLSNTYPSSDWAWVKHMYNCFTLYTWRSFITNFDQSLPILPVIWSPK